MNVAEVSAAGFSVWNGDDEGWSAIAEDCVLHDPNNATPVAGRDAIRAVVAGYRDAMPGMRVEAGDSVVTVGDLIARPWTLTAPDGLSLKGISVGRIRDGQLAESWLTSASPNS